MTLLSSASRTFVEILLVAIALKEAACDASGEPAVGEPELLCPEETVRSGDDCLVACPEGWGRGPDHRCRPPCLEGEDIVDGECSRPCPEGTSRGEEEHACSPDAASDFTVCPADIYDERDAAGARLYVNPSADEQADADGSRAAPYATLAATKAALEGIAESEITVLLAAGEYITADLTWLLLDQRKKLSIVGRCREDTRLIVRDARHGFYVQGESAEFVFKGLDFQGGVTQIIVGAASAVTIDRCAFSDWTGRAAVTAGGVSNISVVDASFAVGDAAPTSALNLSADFVEIARSRFHVVTDGGEALNVKAGKRIVLLDSRVEGSGNLGATLLTESGGESVDIARNAFEGDWVTAGLWIAGGSQTSVEMTLTDTSVENHIPEESSRSTAVVLEDLASVSIDNLLVSSGNVDAIRVVNIGVLDIADSTFRDLNWSGLIVERYDTDEACSISVARSRFWGIGDYSIFHENAYCDLRLEQNVFDRNRKGVFAAPRAFTAEANAIGTVDDTALSVRDAQFVRLGNNTIASVDDAGLALSNLQGERGETYVVEGNRIFDCQGAGATINGTGEGKAVLSNNDIQGIRGKMYERQGETGTTGDGVLAASYSEAVATRVEMVGNTIGRNARSGVLIHGPGSSVTVSETRFETGNGYAGLIPERRGELCDLLAQAGAAVSGPDGENVEIVTGVFTASEPEDGP